MRVNKIVKPLIDVMKPKGRRGRIPVVKPCPYCGFSMSKTDHAHHRPDCLENFKQAPPQPAAPKPAELAQDPGGGYNKDGTFPQT